MAFREIVSRWVNSDLDPCSHRGASWGRRLANGGYCKPVLQVVKCGNGFAGLRPAGIKSWRGMKSRLFITQAAAAATASAAMRSQQKRSTPSAAGASGFRAEWLVPGTSIRKKTVLRKGQKR